MGIQHKVCINIAKPGGTPDPIIRSGTMQIRRKLLDFLFGQQVSILVLSPGDSVQTVEIHELKGGENHDQHKQIQSAP
jgi:hypothetical protein